LLLRKAAISCLRQLAQREAKEVCEHAMTLASESRDTNMVEGKLSLVFFKLMMVELLGKNVQMYKEFKFPAFFYVP